MRNSASDFLSGFEDLISRLTSLARQRVQSGQVSERALARQCGTSQPHIHNVLKGIRTLSPASADRLMEALGLSVPKVLWGESEDSRLEIVMIPMVRNRIGSGISSDLAVRIGVYPMEKSSINGLIDPVVARLSADLAMPGDLHRGDLVLLDQNPAIRKNPDEGGRWVVLEQNGLRVRYVRMRDGRVCMANEATLAHPDAWHPVAALGAHILDVVRARIVWVGREMETKAPGSDDGTGGGD